MVIIRRRWLAINHEIFLCFNWNEESVSCFYMNIYNLLFYFICVHIYRFFFSATCPPIAIIHTHGGDAWACECIVFFGSDTHTLSSSNSNRNNNSNIKIVTAKAIAITYYTTWIKYTLAGCVLMIIIILRGMKWAKPTHYGSHLTVHRSAHSHRTHCPFRFNFFILIFFLCC